MFSFKTFIKEGKFVTQLVARYGPITIELEPESPERIRGLDLGSMDYDTSHDDTNFCVRWNAGPQIVMDVASFDGSGVRSGVMITIEKSPEIMDSLMQALHDWQDGLQPFDPASSNAVPANAVPAN